MDTRSASARSVPAGAAPSRRAHLWSKIVEHRWGYIFVAPWVLLYAIFGIYPLVLSFYLTFFTYSFVRPQDLTFVGLGNWSNGLRDPLFCQSAFNVFYKQAIFIMLTLGLPLSTAFALEQISGVRRIFGPISVVPCLPCWTVIVSPSS